MAVVYIVTVFLVTALLLSIPLFPFWKVWQRLKAHHTGIWNDRGPFGLSDMIASPARVSAFIGVVNLAEKDEPLRQKDPELVKCCRVCKEILLIFPSSFVGQVGSFFLFLYLTGAFSSMIMRLFKH